MRCRHRVEKRERYHINKVAIVTREIRHTLYRDFIDVAMVAHLYYLALKIGDGVIEDGGFICTLYTVLYSMHRRHNVTIVTT